MANVNSFFRPDPAGKKLNYDEIPDWSESFINNRVAANWTIGLLNKPVKLGDKHAGSRATISTRMLECEPGKCDELLVSEVQQLWKMKGMHFDGVFKKGQNIYFFRSPINDMSPGPVCYAENAKTLDESLTRTEAAVLEIWTGLSETIGFSICSMLAMGEGIYRANLNDSYIEDRMTDGLDMLIDALEWQEEHPNEAANPYNKFNWPLDISLEKVEGINDDLWWDGFNSTLAWVGGIAGGVGLVFLAGFGFGGGMEGWSRLSKRLRNRKDGGPDDPDGTPGGGGREFAPAPEKVAERRPDPVEQRNLQLVGSILSGRLLHYIAESRAEGLVEVALKKRQLIIESRVTEMLDQSVDALVDTMDMLSRGNNVQWWKSYRPADVRSVLSNNVVCNPVCRLDIVCNPVCGHQAAMGPAGLMGVTWGAAALTGAALAPLAEGLTTMELVPAVSRLVGAAP